MYRSICILAASAALFTTSVKAQHGSDAEQHAKARAAAYVQALGVDAATAEGMAKVYMEGEEQVAPLREKCAEIQAEVNKAMAPYDEKAEGMLTEEQRNKLAALKKEGKWQPAASCMPAGDAPKAGCGDHGAAKPAGGCCAGKAGH